MPDFSSQSCYTENMETATCQKHGKHFIDAEMPTCPACITETQTGMEVLSFYSRAQAIEDGELIDVSSVALEAGIKFPVALTRAVYGRCVEIPKDVRAQDESGRLWDVLWMLRCAIQGSIPCRKPSPDLLYFSVSVRNKKREQIELKSLCHPGDTPAPCITIMLPDED
jgi:hypothetical protein